MKKTLTELFDQCGPEELDQLLSDELDVSLEWDAMERIRGRALETAVPKRGKKNRVQGRLWLRAAVAACLVLAVVLGGVAYAAEAREYGAAVRFFDENGLSTDGLSREDVKAVYRDITTQRFSCGKTAEVIERSVAGVEIFQEEPTPEELAALWNSRPFETPRPGAGTSYQYHVEYQMDSELGFEVFDRSCLERWEDGHVVWTAKFSQFIMEDYTPVSGGLAVWGYTPTTSGEEPSYAWMALVNDAGTALWETQLDHGFHWERVEAVLDNGDGTWAVISRGELEYLCLSQYSEDGTELSFHKIQVGNYGIWNAARLGDGYLVQLGSYTKGERAYLVKLDREGGLTDSFIYEGEDCYYVLTDMVEFNGRVYLSAYAVPSRGNGGGSPHGEIGHIMDWLVENGYIEGCPSEVLTPMVRDNYTAVLLVCDPEGGAPQTFYSVKGSLGAGLVVNESGELQWDVNSVVSTQFSLFTSAYSISGTCQVYRYAFDESGALVRQEDTGETAAYWR